MRLIPVLIVGVAALQLRKPGGEGSGPKDPVADLQKPGPGPKDGEGKPKDDKPKDPVSVLEKAGPGPKDGEDKPKDDKPKPDPVAAFQEEPKDGKPKDGKPKDGPPKDPVSSLLQMKMATRRMDPNSDFVNPMETMSIENDDGGIDIQQIEDKDNEVDENVYPGEDLEREKANEQATGFRPNHDRAPTIVHRNKAVTNHDLETN